METGIFIGMEEEINNQKTGCCVLQYIPIPLNSGASPSTYVSILTDLFDDFEIKEAPVDCMVNLGFDKKKREGQVFNVINLVILSFNVEWLNRIKEVIEVKTPKIVHLNCPTEVICNERTSYLLNNPEFDSVNEEGLSIEDEIFLKNLTKVFMETTMDRLINIKSSGLSEFIEKNIPEIHL
jgi:hypothetical protein